jgi:hypothetical protein
MEDTTGILERKCSSGCLDCQWVITTCRRRTRYEEWNIYSPNASFNNPNDSIPVPNGNASTLGGRLPQKMFPN